MDNLLIVGDSFSANTSGWPNLLNNYNITNLSTNGSSEYRIFKKLQATDLNIYNRIIIVHTSANRIYVDQNPMHLNSLTHQQCDLIYNDVANNNSEFAQHVTWWFENIFDIDQAELMHSCLIDKIQQITYNIPTIHLTFFDYSHQNVKNLHKFWKKYPGDINHLSTKGNLEVAKFINQRLENA